MSTTYGLFRKMQIKTDENGHIISEYADEDYLPIARQVSGEIMWNYQFEAFADHLDDTVSVYPVDNDAGGIYTVGDIRKAIRRQKENK
jgi:hypothetical protein